ncbi:MAG: hypothetical protein OK457_07410 [Thaumarchaeota archaeon]|nr:hypothetical protein [Nitrososphaerota archaeon]
MKVSLYLRDEVWRKFKRYVLRRTGELRNISSEVQELIEENSADDSLRRGFEKMKVDVKPISFSDVVPVRPSIPTSSGATIRKMRDRRFGSNKDLPRQ